MNLDQREWCRLEMLIYVDKKRELTRKTKIIIGGTSYGMR